MPHSSTAKISSTGMINRNSTDFTGRLVTAAMPYTHIGIHQRRTAALISAVSTPENPPTVELITPVRTVPYCGIAGYCKDGNISASGMAYHSEEKIKECRNKRPGNEIEYEVSCQP